MPAEAGHNISLAYEADPVAAPGVFTTVGEFVGDIPIERTRASTEVTAHNHTVDRYITSVMRRSVWAIAVNYDHGDSSHTGLQDHFDSKTVFGLRFRGPGVTDTTDEIIVSGELTSWTRGPHPVREGVRGGGGSFQPSGPMKIDGVIVGV